MTRVLTFVFLLAATSLVTGQGIYGAKSPVLNVDASNYNSLIAQSNHTSVGRMPYF